MSKPDHKLIAHIRQQIKAGTYLTPKKMEHLITLFLKREVDNKGQEKA